MKSKKSKIWAFLKRDSAEVFFSLFKDWLHGMFVFLCVLIVATYFIWMRHVNYIEEHGETSYLRERNLYIAGAGIALTVLTIIGEIVKRHRRRMKRVRYFERIEREGLKPIAQKSVK